MTVVLIDDRAFERLVCGEEEEGDDGDEDEDGQSAAEPEDRRGMFMLLFALSLHIPT